MNERKTEDLVERRLRAKDYYKPPHTVEKQRSESPKIRKLLRNASKSGTGAGHPEFLIRSEEVSDFLIVIECKADTSRHESPERNKPRDYAVDGVLLYASFLAKEFDVLAIAVSGQTERTLRISHFLHLSGTVTALEWNDIARDIVSFQEYYQEFLASDAKFRQDYVALLDYSRILNDRLQSERITEAQRGFLISGVLIRSKEPSISPQLPITQYSASINNQLTHNH